MLDRMPHGRDDGSATSGATPDGTPDGSPDWTLENDDIVRRALLSLRQDVDAHASACAAGVPSIARRSIAFQARLTAGTRQATRLKPTNSG